MLTPYVRAVARGGKQVTTPQGVGAGHSGELFSIFNMVETVAKLDSAAIAGLLILVLKNKPLLICNSVGNQN